MLSTRGHFHGNSERRVMGASEVCVIRIVKDGCPACTRCPCWDWREGSLRLWQRFGRPGGFIEVFRVVIVKSPRYLWIKRGQLCTEGVQDDDRYRSTINIKLELLMLRSDIVWSILSFHLLPRLVGAVEDNRRGIWGPVTAS